MTMTKLLVAALVLAAAAGCGSDVPDGPVPEQMQVLEDVIFDGATDREYTCETIITPDRLLFAIYSYSEEVIARQGYQPDQTTIEWFWKLNCPDQMATLYQQAEESQ